MVVCGGGLAGIAAACEAAGRGAVVTLVERRPFLGGKAFSFTDRESGRELDNGQHVFLGCCPAYIALLRLLGTLRHTTLQARLDTPVRDRAGRRGHLRAAPLPAPFHLGPSFAAYPLLSAGEKLRALRALAALTALRPGAREALDERSFADWLGDHGQGEGAIARFWDLIVLPTCNDRSDRVSAALAAFVFHEGFLGSVRGSAIGWSRVGLTRLVDPATRSFLSARGGRVVAGTAVTQVEPAGVGLGTGEWIEADGVVLALPPERAHELCPAAVAPPSGIESSPIVNVHLWYDRPVMDEPFTAVVDSPVQWIFNRTAMGDGAEGGHHLAISISGARHEITVPRTAHLGVIFHNESGEAERLTGRFGSFPNEPEAVSCTTAVHPGKSAYLGFKIAKTNAASSTPLEFIVPGVDGASIQIVVP